MRLRDASQLSIKRHNKALLIVYPMDARSALLRLPSLWTNVSTKSLLFLARNQSPKTGHAPE